MLPSSFMIFADHPRLTIPAHARQITGRFGVAGSRTAQPPRLTITEKYVQGLDECPSATAPGAAAACTVRARSPAEIPVATHRGFDRHR